jgi:hypothetical protein
MHPAHRPRVDRLCLVHRTGAGWCCRTGPRINTVRLVASNARTAQLCGWRRAGGQPRPEAPWAVYERSCGLMYPKKGYGEEGSRGREWALAQLFRSLLATRVNTFVRRTINIEGRRRYVAQIPWPGARFLFSPSPPRCPRSLLSAHIRCFPTRLACRLIAPLFAQHVRR